MRYLIPCFKISYELTGPSERTVQQSWPIAGLSNQNQQIKHLTGDEFERRRPVDQESGFPFGWERNEPAKIQNRFEPDLFVRRGPVEPENQFDRFNRHGPRDLFERRISPPR